MNKTELAPAFMKLTVYLGRLSKLLTDYANYKVGLWNVLHSMERQLIQKSQLHPGRLVSIFIDQGPAYTELATEITCI